MGQPMCVQQLKRLKMNSKQPQSVQSSKIFCSPSAPFVSVLLVKGSCSFKGVVLVDQRSIIHTLDHVVCSVVNCNLLQIYCAFY